MTSSTLTAGGMQVAATYQYDGDGRRILKQSGGVTTHYVYDPEGNLAAEYAVTGSAPAAPCTTCYLMADHLGSTRMISDASGNQQQLIDYAPFGEELAGYDGRDARWGSVGSMTSEVGIPQFTGKERDAETGLDYFGARYFSAAQGRFTSPDPLMASAHASNPQSWNRYAYVLNNPLRFADPDGMDVPAAGAQDKKCQIVVKVNVVYDKTVNNGNGFTDKEKKTFEKNQLERAQKDFGNSNIKLDFTYTQGSYTVDDSGHTQLAGLKADSLNLVVSTATPNGASGVSGVTSNGTAISFLNFNNADQL